MRLQMLDFSGAMEDFDTSIPSFTRFAEAYRQRAYGWMAQEDYDAAMKDCERALEIDPIFLRYIRRAQWFGNCRGNFECAMDDLNTAIDTSPRFFKKEPLHVSTRHIETRPGRFRWSSLRIAARPSSAIPVCPRPTSSEAFHISACLGTRGKRKPISPNTSNFNPGEIVT